ncbi:hypothetical protein P3T35_006386 [Kitasatospora sp. GP30]|nr:hypothetical protein [Kitasatospora sp. GP30]
MATSHALPGARPLARQLLRLHRPSRRPDGKPHCVACYGKKPQPRRPCGQGGEVTVMAIRARDSRPALCRRPFHVGTVAAVTPSDGRRCRPFSRIEPVCHRIV